MARIKVKYVGPIKEGLTGANKFIEFKGVTLFIGDQGSGKSTIAKLYSTLSWLEKALMRGDFSIAQIISSLRAGLLSSSKCLRILLKKSRRDVIIVVIMPIKCL